MPYFTTLENARSAAQATLNDRCIKMNLFLEHFPELKGTKFKKPEIRWRAMGAQIAGRAYFEYHVIEMNTNYLSSADWETFLHDTLVHELGHIIAWDLFKDGGHGTAWKAVTRFMGDDGDRCHNYSPVTINKVERKSF